MFRSYKEVIEVKILCDQQDSEVLASIITESLEARNFKQLDSETWTPMMARTDLRIINQRYIHADIAVNK